MKTAGQYLQSTIKRLEHYREDLDYSDETIAKCYELIAEALKRNMIQSNIFPSSYGEIMLTFRLGSFDIEILVRSDGYRVQIEYLMNTVLDYTDLETLEQVLVWIKDNT